MEPDNPQSPSMLGEYMGASESPASLPTPEGRQSAAQHGAEEKDDNDGTTEGLLDEQGQAYSSGRGQELGGGKPDNVVYNAFLSDLGKAGDLSKAMELLEIMREDETGTPPDACSFNTLLHAFAQRGDTDAVDKLLTAMQDESVAPDAVTFNTLVSMWGRRGDLIRAQEMIEKMREHGLSPNEVRKQAVH